MLIKQVRQSWMDARRDEYVKGPFLQISQTTRLYHCSVGSECECFKDLLEMEPNSKYEHEKYFQECLTRKKEVSLPPLPVEGSQIYVLIPTKVKAFWSYTLLHCLEHFRVSSEAGCL